MRILIIASEMVSLTGSPMYNYTLAVNLVKNGHDVDVFSMFSNNIIRRLLVENGVKCITKVDKQKHYNLALLSQNKNQHLLSEINCDFNINIIHSEYIEEKPILSDKINTYIAIRPSIKEHLIKKYGIHKDNITVIYNGVDLKRFSPKKRKLHKGNYAKIVLPCTIDDLRLPFIKYYIDRASEDFRVYIYGHQYREININKWVFVNKAVDDIENYIYDADYVAGILLGRVNLEAMAMGIPSYMHNPSSPAVIEEFTLDRKEFVKRHDISNVAKAIIDLAEKTDKDRRSVNYKQVFGGIFTSNYWGDKDSVSGSGSNLEQTRWLSEQLPPLFERYRIKSILDIPCGDFFWFSKIDIKDINYIGADIVAKLVDKLNEEHPAMDFRNLDICNSDLPKVDLVFCRDCFVHLPYADINMALQNIKRSGSRFLLTTNFSRHTNTDVKLGEWRPINLRKPPFRFPASVEVINEGCTECGGAYNDKEMVLINIEQL